MADDSSSTNDVSDEVDMGKVQSKSARDEVATMVKAMVKEELAHVGQKVQDEVKGQLENVKSDLKSHLLSEIQQLTDKFSTESDSKLDAVKQGIKHQINDEISKMESAFSSKCQNVEDAAKKETLTAVEKVKDHVGSELKAEVQNMIGHVRSELLSSVDSQQHANHAKVLELVAELERKRLHAADQNEGIVRTVAEACVQRMMSDVKAGFEAKIDEAKSHLAAEFHQKIESEKTKMNEVLKKHVDELASDFRTRIESMKDARQRSGRDDDDDDDDDAERKSKTDQRWSDFEARMEHRLHENEVGFQEGFNELKKVFKEKVRKADERWQDRSRSRIFKWFTFTVVVVLSCTVLSVFNAVVHRSSVSGIGNTSGAQGDL